MSIVNGSPRGFESHSPITTLSSTLKEERKNSGLTQEQLAKIVGVGLASIRKIEQGNDSISMALVNKLLHFFGLQLTPSKLVSSPIKKSRALLKTEEVTRRLKALFPIFQSKYGVVKLGLFGSHAYGGQTETSDIDILVETQESLSFKDLGIMQVTLEHIFKGKKIDLMEKKNVKPEYWSSIKEDLIYVTQG